jgi:hypothetical protein
MPEETPAAEPEPYVNRYEFTITVDAEVIKAADLEPGPGEDETQP